MSKESKPKAVDRSISDRLIVSATHISKDTPCTLLSHIKL